ncbi:F-actin-capping protein subunit alpha [Protomyces lactucae-debilis]|uniref:F-actin-capping protein subunit alpha n=1 Tax=Protomyces lactucae-debilis TaxID=2754530 RepID=A0A1Y2FI29_PROLT|nr:F-actin-capping protein subunit alpha [Protomyces lactucae-debilis]ORY83602.1 F-actin-capping protein subunit alpha [Protomyces lactucae-debilis]
MSRSIYKLIQAAGPGEINDVFADIRALVDNDNQVFAKAAPELAQYNKSQLLVVKVDGEDTVLSEEAELADGRFQDARRGKVFAFDHLTLKASDTETAPVPTAVKTLAASVEAYTQEHFPSAAFSVTPQGDNLVVSIVGNKYSPDNFWTGRWRSTYVVGKSRLDGTILLDVHYYEDGNVRLLTQKQVEAVAEPSTAVRSIAQAEKKYQEELNRAFGVLGEGSFKELRRALPVTRSKINWDSVASMRIGQEIQGGRERA